MRPHRKTSPITRAGAYLALAFLLLPMVALVARAPWSELVERLGEEDVRAALVLSIQTSIVSALLAALLGLPLARAMANDDRFKNVMRLAAILPIVLPPVVGGTALLLALGRRSAFGGWLDDVFGFTFFGSPAAVVVAQTFIAMPFFVLVAEAGFRAVDRRYEDVAATLGASRSLAFRTVTLPLAVSSLGAGLILAFARALGEFGATITFAGNLPGSTQTVPLAVFIELQREPDAATALSLLLLAITIAIVAATRNRWWPA
jgi:molybdate transport system permease protein